MRGHCDMAPAIRSRGTQTHEKVVFAVDRNRPRSALAGCSRNNQDAVNNAEINQPAAEDLNELSKDAANDAANAEAAALGNQQSSSTAKMRRPTTRPTRPTTQEQNVSGM